MANSVFRFYSATPRDIQREFFGANKTPLVRFHGLKIGRSPFFKMTVVTEEGLASTEFQGWLDRNCKLVTGKYLGWTGNERSYLVHRPSNWRLRCLIWMFQSRRRAAKYWNLIKFALGTGLKNKSNDQRKL